MTNKKEKTKQQIGLYHISKENVFNVATEKEAEKLDDNKSIIEFILGKVDGRRKPHLLTLKKSVLDSFKPLNVELYFCKIPIDFQWKSFFRDSLVKNENNKSFLEFDKTLHASFLCFLYDNNDIFAFSGGLGNYYIKDFVDDEFGINVLQKIANPNTLKLLKTKNNNFVGNVSVDQRIFRDEQKTNDESRVGKIYSEVVGAVFDKDLFKKVQTLLGLNEKTQINVHAKASMTFSKSFTFEELKEITLFLSKLPTDPVFTFSEIKSLSKRRMHERVIVEELDFSLMKLIGKTLFDLVNKVEVSEKLMFEFCPKEIDLFYSSDKIIARRLGKKEIHIDNSPYGLNIIDVLSKIAKEDSEYISSKYSIYTKTSSPKKKAEILEELGNKYSISCFNLAKESEPIIDKKLFLFANMEMDLGSKPYFRIIEKWYLIKDNFLQNVNAEFISMYDSSYFDFPIPVTWGQDAEDDFKENENTYLEYLADNPIKNMLVLHKVIPSKYNIELCDLMYWNKDELYLIHIKPSFDGAVRVLEKQITHSSKLITEDLLGTNIKNAHIKAFFKSGTSTRKTSGYEFSVKEGLIKIGEDKFVKLFKEKRINFVACIVDPKSNRSLQNIELFKSSIAKLSMIQCYRTIRAESRIGSNFRISQIFCDPNYNEPK